MLKQIVIKNNLSYFNNASPSLWIERSYAIISSLFRFDILYIEKNLCYGVYIRISMTPNSLYLSKIFSRPSRAHAIIVICIILFTSFTSLTSFATPRYILYSPKDTVNGFPDPADTGYERRMRDYYPMDTSYLKHVIEDTSENVKLDEDNYDEILITLNVPRIGSIELQALIYNRSAYLPIREVFNFLKIRNIPSSELDSISGFFINPKATYLIDKIHNCIYYQGKVFKLRSTDLIRNETNLYLKADFFGQVFGLDCKFDFRSLSITMTTKLELPAIMEMQQEELRRNLGRLKGEKRADTTYQRDFSMFHLGMADWSLMTTRYTNGVIETRANINMGARVAGGEADIYLNYVNTRSFDAKQQFYKWKYVNNDFAPLRQVTAGKMYTQSTSSLFAPITGVQVTNTPTTYRRSFGTYRLSDKTEPDWTVELYVNDVLVNYVKADPSGFFTFEVPLVYGNSVIKLKFYSPWGEERIKDVNISIPFNFLPVNEFQYALSAGIVDDDYKSKFSRLNLNYGLSRRITIGGGVEYLSSVSSGQTMPYVNASLRLGSSLLISGEHTYGVRSKALVSYRLPSNLQAEITYTKYEAGQTSIKYNYLSEKKATISMPIRSKSFSAFARMTVNQVTLPKQEQFTSGEFLLSSMYKGISSNFTTYAILNEVHPLVFSNLAFTFRIPFGLRVTPQAQFEYRQNAFSMLKTEIEKNLFTHGFLNLSYEKDLINHNYNVGVGIRYNFSFAQTSLSTRQTEHSNSTVATARGSILFNDITKEIHTDGDNNVGKGGLVIFTYLDINGNGRRDENEPKITGLNLRVNGGRIQRNRKDSTIRVVGLESYTNYLLEVDKNSFENVSWQIKNQSISVVVEPNQFRLIEIPVAVMGEAAGNVYFENYKGVNGLGRIIVNIYDKHLKLVTKLLTESDGYFNFMGLTPGNYTVGIDPDQLDKLHMKSDQIKIPFTIKLSRDGDVVDNLKFTLK